MNWATNQRIEDGRSEYMDVAMDAPVRGGGGGWTVEAQKTWRHYDVEQLSQHEKVERTWQQGSVESVQKPTEGVN